MNKWNLLKAIAIKAQVVCHHLLSKTLLKFDRHLR